MKKLMYLFVMAATLPLAFVSCDKDDDGGGGGSVISEITATDVNDKYGGSSQIVTVKAFISRRYYNPRLGMEGEILARAPYINNGFVLELPATMDTKYLELFPEDLLNTISISDKSVRLFRFDDIAAFDVNDKEVGFFYLETGDTAATDIFVSWFYVDKNVTVKGKIELGNEIYNYNLILKKGWNVVYVNSTKNGVTYTSQKSSGETYSWNFYPIYH